MTGLVYIGTILLAALFAATVLAFESRHIQHAALLRDLGRLAGFRVERKIQSCGKGIAVDNGSGQVCLISTEGGKRQLRLLRFADVLMAEVLRDGASALRAVRSDIAAAAVPPCRTSAAQARGAAFRLVARSNRLLDHVVVMPSMHEAVRWHQLFKSAIHRSTAAAPRAAAVPPAAVTASVVRADTKTSVRDLPAAEPSPAPNVSRRSEPSERRSTPLSDAKAQCEGLVPLLAALLEQRIAGQPRLVIPERVLRDEAGVDMPIIQFHQCLNQLKRNKAFPSLTLSYSRQDETWKISRRRR